MSAALLRGFRFVASLRLTVFCLLSAMVLVLAGTLAQVDWGIYEAQRRYFESWVVWGTLGSLKLPVFPGGMTIGTLFLVNLSAAHFSKFRFSWAKGGIHLIHGGLILLLTGQLATTIFSVESQMRLDEGETKNYSEHLRLTELAIVDTSPQDHDAVLTIPDSLLVPGAVFQHPKIPLVLTIQKFYPNAHLAWRRGESSEPTEATKGLGLKIAARELPLVVRSDERNLPAVWVAVRTPEGEAGVWLFSNALGQAQEIQSAGKTYRVELRPRHYTKAFSLKLLNFTHEKHAGTEIPRFFSSRLLLTEPGDKKGREILISMNEPLRYAGETYYQASFDNGDKTSILQVVRNPAWLFPYLSSALITLGMVWQFGSHLMKAQRRKK